MDLNTRQIAIIKAVVEEYAQTAEPVGSVTLEKKYALGVSPATLRNEMAVLEEKGYLKQPHTSSGRVPTPLSIKLYVNELMQEQRLSVAEEVSVRERVWESRDSLGSLLREATKTLAERTKSLSVAALDEDRVYHHGYSYLFRQQEFANIELTRQIFGMLDQTKHLLDIFDKSASNSPIHLLIGDELGNELLEPVSCLYADIHIGDKRGSLGIISSCRQTYDHNIPLVRYIASLINQIAIDW